ncbi:Na+/H+ antiporter NhaA [Actinomadura kijaniata]|uniref:Na+/H+ antiporter NhaA n=1 Tax=Actinomadura kijaniata TaxID=46161 RepID=UPI003F1DBE05
MRLPSPFSTSRPGGDPRTGGGARVEALAYFLRRETTGGQLLLAATAVALLWANLAPRHYQRLWGTELGLGPDWLHLHLNLSSWVSDGLLAIFFFIAGMEVKRELTVGELAGWRAAALPMFAAAGGMLTPALIALAVSGGRAAEGGAWAIPVATDIAFALGVLALVGSGLPSGVRVLLLSLAVVDDLGAIALIAALFTRDLNLLWLAAALALCGGYRLAQRRRVTPAWLMVPLVVAVWICVHASGVHATVAGILLGLLTPVAPVGGEPECAATRLERRLHPVSAGIIVPLFAVAAAGIPLGAITETAGDPVAQGVFVGLLAGKAIGIFGGAWLAVRFRLGALPPGVGWADVFPVAVLGGIGYTVSLLVARLASDDPSAAERAATAVLAASLVASLLAVLLLKLRGRVHRSPRDRSDTDREPVAS